MKDALNIYMQPVLQDARLVFGLTGWMDGGDVSTGTLEYLVANMDAQKFAEINPEEFLIYNFPGSMEVSALFRPHTRIEEGRVRALEEPANVFYCVPSERLILFNGREPHFRWPTFAECIFRIADACDISTFVFVGSVAGIVPHTRAPRFFSVVSEDSLVPLFQRHALEPSNYAGPASFVTYLSKECASRGIRMVSIVAEIPSYVQGRNVNCIEASVRKLNTMLGLSVRTDDLRTIGQQFEEQLSRAVAKRPDLAEFIEKLENEYDEHVIDPKMADLKSWFEKQDIRLDQN